MAVALMPFSGLALPAWVLSVIVLAALTGAFGWALHLTLERLRLPLALLAPILWTTLEWTQAHLGPFAFPWLGLGHALAPFPVLAGAADLVGARGLTFWVAGVNGLLATALYRYRGTYPRPVGWRVAGLAVAAVLLFLVPAAYGHWRASTLELRPVARVAVVQPGIPQGIRIDAVAALDTSLAVLTRRSLAVDEPVDLVAWPEVALTAELAGDPAVAGAVRTLSAALGAPILTGAYGSGDDGRLRNSAFLVDSLATSTRYDKRRLVPFVERVPMPRSGRFGDGLAGRLGGQFAGRFGGLEPGRDGPVVRRGAAGGDAAGGDVGFGVLICFESTFAGLSRDYRRAGADFLVNITNDAWFSRDGPLGRTSALWQHPAHMTLRAVENRMGVARSANMGISMFIDPLGRSRQATPFFSADARVDTILGTDELTLYTRWGDWLATSAAVVSLALLIAAGSVGPPGRKRPGLLASLRARGLFLLAP
jgi:apolipoprotein N-acyltransferase